MELNHPAYGGKLERSRKGSSAALCRSSAGWTISRPPDYLPHGSPLRASKRHSFPVSAKEPPAACGVLMEVRFRSAKEANAFTCFFLSCSFLSLLD